MTKILTEEQAANVQPDLPEAGHKRDEELARRKDELEEAVETQTGDTHTVDPHALTPDRELQRLIRGQNALAVSHADPAFVYCWVYFGLNGQMVWQKKAQGWQVVQGDMKEAVEFKHEDSVRRVGDTLLMRMRRDHYAKLEMAQRKVARRQEEGIAAELEELGMKYRRTGIRVHTDPDAQFASGRPMMDIVEKRAARQTAMKTVDKRLREGTVPGMEIGEE